MAYKPPSRRSKIKEEHKLNLIPILDAVFIFIFFLLMSAQFVSIYEINSDVPIISDSRPPKNEKDPFALTLQITEAGFALTTGVPAKTIKRITKTNEGLYDLNQLHDFLVSLKKKHTDENMIIFEPQVDVEYEIIVQIMDAVRMLHNTDETIFTKDQDGIDVIVEELFNKIVFGNLMS